jgi:hypothetical protein
MSRDLIIVTGGNSRYFALMSDLIRSLRDKPQGRDIAIGVLDCGLAPDERAWCEAQGARVVEPGWDVVFGDGLAPDASFRAMTARPHLRSYFPGYNLYLWLDADVWVQDWQAIELMRLGARDADIAIVPEMHRSYRNFRDGRDDFEGANGQAYADAFGAETAARLIRRPLNNAGVFAISARSTAWKVWAKSLASAATRSANMIDQIALNVAIHDLGIKEARLPATCNWIAHLATPVMDADTGLLCEPDLPFAAIGILHMTLGTKWAPSVDLAIVRNGRRTHETRSRSLRYPGPGG